MDRFQSRAFTRLRGTLGYLAPEWLLHASVTEKSDVFSFGMVLLEIISGRKNLDLSYPEGMEYFPCWAVGMIEEGKIMDVVDPELRYLADYDDQIQVSTFQSGQRLNHFLPCIGLGIKSHTHSKLRIKEAVHHGKVGLYFKYRLRVLVVTKERGEGSQVSHGKEPLAPLLPASGEFCWEISRAAGFRKDDLALELYDPYAISLRGVCWGVFKSCGGLKSRIERSLQNFSLPAVRLSDRAKL
ncbi:hypothetical protein KI387_022868 [Taxus chinensis]|uniref:Protein kinase domain-containing protein n=1 Tax=Taxus chinensis TaxID=29808 RepID=A0AA38L7H5_TAXCH|nr:hypothetical protein KI387_022868 [Taxus chinensis]